MQVYAIATTLFLYYSITIFINTKFFAINKQRGNNRFLEWRNQILGKSNSNTKKSKRSSKHIQGCEDDLSFNLKN